IKLCIPCPKDFTHPARAKLGGDAIATDGLADHFFKAAVQLRTTVIGLLVSALFKLVSGRGMRNRWLLKETAKLFQLPLCPAGVLMYAESNSGIGTDDSRVDPAALIPTETIFPELSASI